MSRPERGDRHGGQYNPNNYVENLGERYSDGAISGWIKETFQNAYDAYYTRNLTNGLLSIKVDTAENEVVIRDNVGGMDKNTVFTEYLYLESESEKEGTGFRGQGSGVSVLLPEQGSSIYFETLHGGNKTTAEFLIEEVDNGYDPVAYELEMEGKLKQDGTRVVIPNVKEEYMKELKKPETFRNAITKYFNEALLDPNFDIEVMIDNQEVVIEPEDHTEYTTRKSIDIDQEFDGPINIKNFKVYIHSGNRKDLFEYTGRKMVRLNNEFGMTVEYYRPQGVEKQSKISALVELENELEEPIKGTKQLKKLEKASHEGYKSHGVFDRLKRDFIRRKIREVADDVFTSDKETEMTESEKRVAKKIEKNLGNSYVGERLVDVPGEGGDDPEKPHVSHMSIMGGRYHEFRDDIKVDIQFRNPTGDHPQVELVTQLLYPRDSNIDTPIQERRTSHHFTEDAIEENIQFEGLDDKFEKGRYRIRSKIVPKTHGYEEDSRSNFIRLEVEQSQSEGDGNETPGLKIHKNEFDKDREPENRRQSKYSGGKDTVDINVLSPSWIKAEEERRLNIYKYNQALEALKSHHIQDVQDIEDRDERLEKIEQIIEDFAKAKSKIDFDELSEKKQSELKQKREVVDL